MILTPVPQANGEPKERPAIFLREMPPYRDLLVCGVSTQSHQYVKDFGLYRIKGVIFHWHISGYKFNPPQWKRISFLKRSLLR